MAELQRLWLIEAVTIGSPLWMTAGPCVPTWTTPAAPHDGAASRPWAGCYDDGRGPPQVVRSGESLMSVNRSLTFFAVVLLGQGLFACSTLTVANTYDPTVEFSQYHTFAFRTDRQLDDPFRQKMAERLITQDFTQKGFSRNDTAPDILVGLVADVGLELAEGTIPAGAVVWSTWGPYDGLSLAVGDRDIMEAGFVVTLRDARDRRLLWRGIAQGTAVIGEPEVNEKRGRAALEKLLATFPPKRK